MALTRYLSSTVLAVVITLSLIYAMQGLIAMSDKELDKSKGFKIPDFVHVPTPDDLNMITPKPPKPPKPTEQPDQPKLQKASIDPNVQTINIGQASFDTSINMNAGIGLAPGDGEYLPIVKVAPIYPSRALSRGIEGYVIVEFTVTKTGSVRDPFVVESDPPNVFDRSAMRAALKFKYKPRMVDGEPVAVSGVQNMITFKIED
jgi:protein TonB